MSMDVSRGEEEVLRGQVPINGIFKHYKGNYYKVLALARSSEDLELCVVYQSLYNSREFGDQALWIRPLKFFVETVVKNGLEIPRFQLMSDRPLD